MGHDYLEHRIERFKWPAHWGDDLRFFIYGDFKSPDQDVEVPELGIVVHHLPQEKTTIGSACCVLEASVQISERTIPAIVDAVKRINVLLGSWTLVTWGNAVCGSWCYITQRSGGRTYLRPGFDDEAVHTALRGILGLSADVRKKVEAALFWIREPRVLPRGHFREDQFRIYSAYWNAFECLVDAVCILHPQQTPTKPQKQQQIDDFFAAREGKLTSNNIRECYQQIVNPGFVGKAKHALRTCFPETAEAYIRECFELKPKFDRLYDIRNAINHGEIEAENPEEIIRVEPRLSKLWTIIWGMFGSVFQLPAPVQGKPVTENRA